MPNRIVETLKGVASFIKNKTSLPEAVELQAAKLAYEMAKDRYEKAKKAHAKKIKAITEGGP